MNALSRFRHCKRFLTVPPFSRPGMALSSPESIKGEMPMRAAFFVLMTALAGTTPALAGPAESNAAATIPTFDIAAKCERQLMYPGCVEAEHAAVAALHFWWSKVRDERTKTACIAEASADPAFNYSHLMGCIGEMARLPGHSMADAGHTPTQGATRGG
jgi:hypothetical protein